MFRALMVTTIVLTASTASAYSARLLAPDDAKASASGGVSLAPVPPSASSMLNAPASVWLMRGATAGVGMAAVPLSLWFTSVIGGLSNNLLATAIPSLLVMGLLAPTITALISWVMANTNMPDGQRVGFWLPWLGSVVIHCALLVVGGFLGLSIGAPAGLMLFSVIDGFAMSFTITGIQQLAGRSVGAVSALETHSPGESTMNVVTLSQVAF